MYVIKVKALRSVEGPAKVKRKGTDWVRIYRTLVEERPQLKYKDLLRFSSKIHSGYRFLDARRQSQICTLKWEDRLTMVHGHSQERIGHPQ